MNNTLKSYNSMLIESLILNKFTLLTLFAISGLGYISIPHLEQYHKSLKNNASKEKQK